MKDSCINKIITNSNHIWKAGVADINISDHQLIYFIKKKNKESHTKSEFLGRSYRNVDIHLFHKHLENINWNSFDEANDPNQLWEIMCNNIKTALDDICPLKKFKIKMYKEPWISHELLELINDKDSLLKKAKRTTKN